MPVNAATPLVSIPTKELINDLILLAAEIAIPIPSALISETLELKLDIAVPKPDI